MRGIKSASAYFLSSAFNKAIPFFMLPVLTRLLSPQEYGKYSIFQVLLSFSIPMMGMALQFNIARNFFKKNKTYIAELNGNLIVILLSNGLFYFVGISLYTCFIPEVFGIESVWIYGAWFAAILNVLTQFALVLLRNQDRVLFFGAMEIGNTALNLSLAFMLIKFFHYSWPALVISLVLANSIFALLAILYMLRNEYLRISLNLKMIKEVLVVSIPLVPHAVSGVIIALSDRLFIRHFNGDSSVAIYSAGYTLCMVILLFTDAFNKVWSPWLFKQLAEVTESRKIKIVQITYFYAIGVGIISLLYIGICQYLVDWILPISYQPAKVYIIWVIPAFAIQGLYFVVFPYLVHLGKTQFLGFMTGIAAITNLFGNYYLIRKNGPVGAAQSTLVSYIALVVIVWCYVCRAYPMPWLSPMRKVKTSIILSFRRYI